MWGGGTARRVGKQSGRRGFASEEVRQHTANLLLKVNITKRRVLCNFHHLSPRGGGAPGAHSHSGCRRGKGYHRTIRCSARRYITCSMNLTSTANKHVHPFPRKAIHHRHTIENIHRIQNSIHIWYMTE